MYILPSFSAKNVHFLQLVLIVDFIFDIMHFDVYGEGQRMVKRMAVLLTEMIISENMISEELKDWYTYSYIRIFATVISFMSILLLSVIFKSTLPSVLLLFFFYILRSRTGGFHCSDFWKCFILSNVVYVAILFVEPFLREHYILTIITMTMSAGYIFVVGTVNHPDMAYDLVELNRSKMIARSIVMIEFIFIISMGAIGINKIYVSYMSISIMLCAVLIVIAKFFKQEVKPDGKQKES